MDRVALQLKPGDGNRHIAVLGVLGGLEHRYKGLRREAAKGGDLLGCFELEDFQHVSRL